MSKRRDEDEAALHQFFERFVNTGMLGQVDASIALFDEPYCGVGMGEQGLFTSKAQAEQVMRNCYQPMENAKLEFEITQRMIVFLNEDAAILSGSIHMTTTPALGVPMHSGLMQTVGVRRKGEGWVVGFTHASPILLSWESVEANPFQFVGHTLSRLKAELRSDLALYLEVNLTQNTVLEAKGRFVTAGDTSNPTTLEEAILYGLCGRVDAQSFSEYTVFFSRTRLLGLFSEGVYEDSFTYHSELATQCIWVQVKVNTLRNPYSGDISAIISFTEITGHKREVAHLSHKAFHDALTGVFNREGFEMEVAQALGHDRVNDCTALLMIDLDDFKQINDRLGHQVGDTALAQISKALCDTFSDVGIVGRIGGDEFMVFVRGGYSLDWIEERANHLLGSTQLQMGIDKQLPISISIGIAFGHANATFEKLYRVADIALYTAKKSGKCRFHLINVDTNREYTNTQASLQIASLQTLLNDTKDYQAGQSRTPYEALVENIPSGVLMISITDTVKLTYCNDWLKRRFGYTNGELSRMQDADIMALVHPADIHVIQKAIEDMRRGQDQIAITYRISDKEGRYHHISLNASMTEHSKEESLYYGINSDVDELMQMQQQLQSSQSQLLELMNAIPGGIAVYEIGESLKATHFGKWIHDYTGYTEEERRAFTDQQVMDSIWPADLPRVLREMQRLREGADSCELVIRLVHKAGHSVPVYLLGTVTHREHDTVTLSTVFMARRPGSGH